MSLLISLYNNYCMFPLFEQLPQDLRGQLTDPAKSSLNACRERFVTFLNDYNNYLGAFDDSFAERYLEIRHFPAPKPL